MNRRNLILIFSGCCLSLMAGGPAMPPVNPYAEQTELPGKFIWFDLVTDDVDRARHFYRELFGWEFETLGTGTAAYTVIRHKQRAIGGMVFDERTDPNRNESQWIGFISVPDVTKVVKGMKSGSGEVLVAPTKLSGRGMYAILTDAEGAVFGVCRSSSGDPPDYQPQQNEWLWAECWSGDPEGAAGFYKAIGGYTVKPFAGDTDHVALHLKSQGFSRAGLVKIPDPQIRSGWLYYVRAANLAQTLEQVRSLGGQVLVAPENTTGWERVAIIEDPTGAPLGLAEWNPVVKEKE